MARGTRRRGCAGGGVLTAATEIFLRLARAGISLTHDGDRLLASPSERLDDDLRGLIRQHKPQLLSTLAELTRLVRSTGELYGFTEQEHREALEIAHADPVAALECFRAIAAERTLPASTENGERRR